MLTLAMKPFFGAFSPTWGPFLESPGNLTGPKLYFEIKLSRKIGCFFTSNEVHFVSLADNFTVQFLSFEKRAPGRRPSLQCYLNKKKVLLEQEKSSTPTGLVWDTNIMDAV